MEAEDLARRFHETYERLAPEFGYETRKETKVPWEKVPRNNRQLITAVCAEVMFGVLVESIGQLEELRRVVRLFMGATATSAGDGIALANEEARRLGFKL